MRKAEPKPPKSLNSYARELLDALAGHAEAAEIVLGGGVALSHYLEYRGTVDLDAWWRDAVNPEAREKIQSSEDRTRAAAVRGWFKNVFCPSETK
ncbi:MAG: hypothetical protein ACRETJ_00355 [Steroidobacteraceae bacterium]